MTTKLVYEHDQIAEYARLVYAAAAEHEAPNFAIDLAACGLREEGGGLRRRFVGPYRYLDADGLRLMARRWREYEFEPSSFADRIEQLADAVGEGG